MDGSVFVRYVVISWICALPNSTLARIFRAVDGVVCGCVDGRCVASFRVRGWRGWPVVGWVAAGFHVLVVVLGGRRGRVWAGQVGAERRVKRCHAARVRSVKGAWVASRRWTWRA